MFKIGLIGCGAIGSALVEAVLNEDVPGSQLVAILDISSNVTIRRAQQVLGTRFADTIEQLISSRPDLVVEAAGHQAVAAYGRFVISAGIDLLVMSVGALADPHLRKELTELAVQRGTTILIPSGAIGGLDLLRAGHSQGQLEEVVLTSIKHPSALAGQPYLVKHGLDLSGIDEPLVVFEGLAADACLAFPKSTNIAAAVSLAGLGFDRTRVCVVADPGTARTVHTLEAKGSFGEMRLTLHNFPHPENPRTSFLACLGAVAAIRNVQGPLRFV